MSRGSRKIFRGIVPRCPSGYDAIMQIDPSKYVRIGTAAGLAGVTRAYLRRLVTDGRISAVPCDGIYLVLRTEAEKLGRQRENAGRKK